MKIAPVSADLLIKIGMAGAVVLVLVYAVKKISNAGSDLFDAGANALGGAWQYGTDAVGSAASAVDSGVANVVVGTGGMVGIPATNQDQCTLDLAAGDTWAASFSCPASRFIKEGLFK
jgi:hypothetical protein